MYKFIEERRTKYTITEADIKEVEERFNITFPPVLRNFYLEHNGDKIRECIFKLKGNEYMVHDMHYIKIKEQVSVDLVYQWQLDDGDISPNMIPFAYDLGGESYYWSTENGKVYFINGEDIENPQYVCESINEFFKLMEEAEPF